MFIGVRVVGKEFCQVLFNFGYLFQMLAACMGGALLSSVCLQFASDYGHSVGGLPDLTLWDPRTLRCKVSQWWWEYLNGS